MRRNIDGNLTQLLEFLNKFIDENGYPPTVREICSELSIKSTATAFYYINKLKERGFLDKSPSKNRALGLKKETVKFVTAPLLGNVPCGEPVFATENYDGYYPLPIEFGASQELFLLTATGDSMINAGITEGDKLIVRKQEDADNGDIVVALLDDSATVKRFYKESGRIVLHPENPSFSDIILDNVVILGKVVGLLRKF